MDKTDSVDKSKLQNNTIGAWSTGKGFDSSVVPTPNNGCFRGVLLYHYLKEVL